MRCSDTLADRQKLLRHTLVLAVPIGPGGLSLEAYLLIAARHRVKEPLRNSLLLTRAVV